MVRLSLLSSIGLLGFFSALLFSFLSLWFIVFVTVCICCCLLAFNLRQHQTLHTPSITTKTDTASSSSTSDIPPPLDPNRKLTYDVFLSFRGEDTRKNFTDHLYAALKRNGIYTFRDDEELGRGESIAPYLLKAIDESRYAVVVLSRNYANSSWCLDEMARIVECMKVMGQKVYPVFYDVDPSEVRHQRGNHFGKAFEEHQKRFQGNPHKVQRWKDALFQVANLSGWHLQNGSEAKLIEEIVRKIFIELNQIIPISEGLVGMDSHLNEMLSYLDIGHSNDVRIIGICGMGGIGKTTIAQVVSERVRPQFEGYSFLENVREVTEKQGAVHLQQKLLSDLLEINVNVQNTKMGKDTIRFRLKTKRVLIILDDVDQDEQLEMLCHREWFGPGSRIIITSRNEHLFSAVDGDKVYKVKPLTEPDALQLFSSKAFKKDQQVGEEFLKLSKEFLKYANGLPLVIKVLGSSVRGRRIELWSSTLDRLKKNPEKKIIDVLKVSFDGLEETEKRTFLDIACFFKGYGIGRVKRILQGNDHHLDIDIEVLMEKSMITLFGRTLWMHDLIQELGWEIVRQECREEPGKRSRLWLPNEIIHVFDRSKGTSAVQSIFLEGPTNDVVHSINDSFSNMDRLRLLKIWNVKFSGNIKYLSKELQYLAWLQCPLDSFPSNFQPDNLVELSMYASRIKQLWRGEKGWGMLRLIDMTYSQYLISTPDFTQVPFLEELVLEGCTRLVEVHPSLGSLKKLFRLNMKFCTSVESLPPFTNLESLEFLSLSLCSRLKKFPEIEGNMESLLELHLDGTSIVELPPSVERLTGLTKLNLRDCKSLLHLPSSIHCLTSLEHLDLIGCSKLEEISENLKCAESLEQIYIGGTAIRDISFLVDMRDLKVLSCRGWQGDAPRSLLLPTSLSKLTSLIELDLSYCNLMDGDIPDDLSSLSSLRMLDLSGNCFVRLPESFFQLSKLEAFFLRKCTQLESVPKKLPFSLQYVIAEGCTSLTDYPNQIKVLTSEESGVTTINSLIDSSLVDLDSTRSWTLNDDGSFEMHLIHNRHTEEQRVDRFSLPIHVHLKDVELQTLSNPFSFVQAENEIPEWFETKSGSTPISIKITDYEWKGVAACAVFSVNATTDAEFSNYWYHFILETEVVRLKPHVIDWERDLRPYIYRSSSDLLLIKYEPSFRFSEWELNRSTEVSASFETNNPFMLVHECGIRLVYEEDAGWHMTHILPASDAICLNEDKDDAVLESGWLIQDQVDKPALKWEKFIAPSEEDCSTLVLRKNIESVLPRYLEALNDQSIAYQFNLSGSPAWFKNSFSFIDTVRAGSWCSAPIDMPQNLHKSKKWMGFAIHASFAEEVGHVIEEDQEDNYHVYIVLKTTGGKLYIVYTKEFKHVRSSEEHHQLFVVYIPRAQILESAMLISYMIDSPHVKFRISGIRVVYKEDIQGLADTIIQCMQKEDSLEFYDKLVVENWIGLIRLQGGHLEGMSNPKERDSRTRRDKEFELHSQKYINWDWSARISVHCTFYRAEISKWKWFMHFKEGSSAEIQLPPNLFDHANWLGIAVCAFYRLSHEDPNMSAGSTSPDSEYNVLTCRMKSDVDWADLHDLIFQGSVRKPKLTEFEHDSTWFYYIPRKGINKFWRECTLARATFLSSRRWIGVHGCALGLVYKEDVERLVQTLTSCELP